MTRNYIPDIHDKTLIEMNTRWKRNDMEISDAMGFTVSTIKKHRERLGLKANARVRQATSHVEKERPGPDDRPNPVVIAARTLGSRFVEKPTGYWVDNRPVNLDRLIQMANRERVRIGLPQIPGREAWQVKP